MSISSIHSNFGSSAAGFNLNRSVNIAALSSARLSSGKRNVTPADDPASLSIGMNMMAQLSGMRSSLANASQGSSMMQVASGGINQIMDILAQQKALAVQAQSGSLTASDRSFLNQTFQELTEEINQIASTTNFNGINLLAGGLGATSTLVTTNALAAAFDPTAGDLSTGVSAAGATPIQAFDETDGSSRAGVGTVGFLNITDAANTVLANQAYGAVNTSLVGKFESFKLSNITYLGSATLTATINGVEFTGNVAHAAAATSLLLHNGSTYIHIRASGMNLTNDGTAALAEAQLATDFRNTVILRTGIVSGVDFAGTRMRDIVGTATSGIASVRLAESGNVNISNFRYLGNGGADENVLSVDINGRTFSATGVTDSIGPGTGTKLVFENGNGEALIIDITGMDAGAVPNTDIDNIRTNMNDRNDFINALNVAFSRAGGGLDFNVGNDTKDMLALHLDSAAASNLYSGATLDIATTGTATTTQAVLDGALSKAGAIQAQIGALQARFDYAAAAMESAIVGQDEARGKLLDTDIASESTLFASAQVQIQAGVAALAQSNQMPSYLLRLVQQ